MIVSTRTFISLGSLVLAVGCGSGSDGNGGNQQQNSAACPKTQDCMTDCMCQTSNAAQCVTACAQARAPAPTGQAGSTGTVDPAGQQGCTKAPACGSCSTACDSCKCQATDVAQCASACATGVGGAGPTGAGGSPAAGAGGIPAIGAGGTPATGIGGAGVGLPPGDTWTVNSNLDANGKLIVPAGGTGYQVATPVFDLQPGEEVFKCFHVQLPNTALFPVGQWESQMTAGSHHFILYKQDGDTTPSGTLVNSGCTSGFGGPTWLYTAGTPHAELPMPDGVAMPIPANQRVVFDMHYINTGTSVIHANVILNMNKVKAATYENAEALVSFNLGIAIPPNGTQTVGGDCTPPPGAKFFVMGTHTHRRGIDASIKRVGGANEVLVHTTNWDNPDPGLWENPPYLTFAPGEKFHYSCSYQNDRNATTTVGTSAANNEMCMAITYFFPAMSGGSCN